MTKKHLKKSWWHLPRIIIMFTLFAAFWYLLFKGMWLVHTYFYPEHNNQLGLFWQGDIGIKSFLSSFLLAMPLLLPALGIALIVSNVLMWLVLPARLAFQQEAKKLRTADFLTSISTLTLILVKYLLPIGIGLSLLGAITLKNLS